MNRTHVLSLLASAGRGIRKRLVPIAMLAGVMLMLIPPPPASGMPQYETIYTVWYDNDHMPCMIGPVHPPSIEGEWTVDCHGDWSGYGWRPGDSCAYTVTTQGEACSGG
jgi:hypothetical protein